MVRMRYVGILLLLLLMAAKHESPLTRHLRKANEYVLAHTRYRTHRLPKVVWLSRAEMNKRSADSEAACHDDSDGVTMAMEDDGVMYLTKGEIKLGRDDQFIVHELVHFQQETNPHRSHRLAVLEKEAYAVQTRYVKDTHRGEPPDPDMVAIISQQRCTI